MKLKSIFIVILLLVSLTFGLSANDYRIVLGSFTGEKNPGQFVTMLEKAGIKAITENTLINGRRFTRVMVAEKYPTYQAATDALGLLKNQHWYRTAGPKDIWIRPPQLATIKVAAEALPKELDAVEGSFGSLQAKTEEAQAFSAVNSAIPLNAENPIAVLVGEYRSRPNAEEASKALEAKKHQPYILKTFQESEGILFDVMTGAFKTTEEAQGLLDTLQKDGIPAAELTSWSEKEACSKAFDELPAADRVEFLPPTPAWDTIPKDILGMLSTCPLPEGMGLKSLVLVNQQDNPYSLGHEYAPSFFLDHINPSAGWSMRLSLEDLLSKEQVSLETFIGTKDAEKYFNQHVQDTISNGASQAWLNKKITGLGTQLSDDSELWYGWDETKKQGWKLSGAGSVVQHILAGKGENRLLTSESLVKTLAILPTGTDAQLWSFMFSILSSTYAEERGNAQWAKLLVGNWSSTAFIKTNTEPLSIGAFDLNYTTTASRIHQMFMSANTSSTGDTLHRESRKWNVKDAKGWYLGPYSNRGNELSFAQGSFIICINTEVDALKEPEELQEWAERLPIWDD
ncbi:MAG TPA: SPOR domain-containing protein [Treponemataceae bacterium]|nr:SPOR domain-containing protein [Treponemataceae bacterium]